MMSRSKVLPPGQKSSDKFTKIASDLMFDVKDLVNWGLEEGHTTPEKMRHTVASRREAAVKLIEGGMSQREAAKVLGVTHTTIQNDVAENLPESGKKLASKKRKSILAAPSEIKLDPFVRHGDFREMADEIADESAQLVFTDPPYDVGSAELYGDAARVARRILRPGGSFLAYCGHKALPYVLNACSPYLKYWWTCAVVHTGGMAILDQMGIRAGWKPMVWFVNGGRGDTQNIIIDTIGGGREKADHEWQQSEAEASYFIEKLTFESGLVVDFFAGGGTTLAAAKKLNRKYIGFDQDIEAAIATSRRLEAAE